MKKKPKPVAVDEKPEVRWIPARLTEAWIEEDGRRITLRFSTGGYKGRFGVYREIYKDVILQGREPWEE
jgi:hypothetical protein